LGLAAEFRAGYKCWSIKVELGIGEALSSIALRGLRVILGGFRVFGLLVVATKQMLWLAVEVLPGLVLGASVAACAAAEVVVLAGRADPAAIREGEVVVLFAGSLLFCVCCLRITDIERCVDLFAILLLEFHPNCTLAFRFLAELIVSAGVGRRGLCRQRLLLRLGGFRRLFVRLGLLVCRSLSGFGTWLEFKGRGIEVERGLFNSALCWNKMFAGNKGND